MPFRETLRVLIADGSAPAQGTCVLDAEPKFLPHLLEIHRKFPKLRIVLEHCTTAAAVECVSFYHRKGVSA